MRRTRWHSWRDHYGHGSVSNRKKQAYRARQRIHKPWPSFLDYNNDDDFFEWYSGEVMPSPERITAEELGLIDKRAEEMIDAEDVQLFTDRSGICRLAFPYRVAK